MNTSENEMKEFVAVQNTEMQTEKKAPPAYFESSGEFTLPDYMEPVQKVLRLESKVLMPTVSRATGEVQMHGSALHSLIYVGQSGEVAATVLPTDYRFAVQIENGDAPLSVELAQTATSYRLLGPRKISIRAKSAAQVSTYPVTDLAPKTAADGQDDSICCLYQTVRQRTRRCYDPIELDVDERIDASQDAKPIWCDATAAVTDIRVHGGEAQIRGDVYAKVLFCVGTRAKMAEKKIRFDAMLPLEDAGVEGAFAKVQVQSTEVSEEDGAFVVDVSLKLCLCGEGAAEVSVCTDAFSTFAPTEIERVPICAFEPVILRQGVFSVSGSVPGGAFSDAGRIVDTTGEAKIETVKAEGGKIKVCGYGEMQAIYEGEGGYGCGSFRLPFEISFDAADADGCGCYADAEVVSAHTRIDGDRLICDAEIALTVFAERRADESAVVSIALQKDTPYETAKHPICIVFPKDGESLWSVAKQYRTPPHEIARENRLRTGAEPMDLPRTWEAPLLISYK
ncbi:MAG: LysM peptidoglycan-binding domain-containing protein [Clostridia bacterium]|nr:LysM peptidoglycan-binding domain-containing protein [Clostridia bacterium]